MRDSPVAAYSAATCHRLSNYRRAEVRAGKLGNWSENINPRAEILFAASSVVSVINDWLTIVCIKFPPVSGK